MTVLIIIFPSFENLQYKMFLLNTNGLINGVERIPHLQYKMFLLNKNIKRNKCKVKEIYNTKCFY